MIHSASTDKSAQPEKKETESDVVATQLTDLDVRSLLDSAPDAMVIVDATGSIVAINRQTQALFGYARNELIGQPVEILLPHRFRGGHTAHRNSFSAQPRTRPMGAGLELFGRNKSGAEFPVEISLSPFDGHEGGLVASAIRDITEQKKLQSRLKEAKQEAEKASIAKGRFLSAASHDLRQPLQALALLNRALFKITADSTAQEIIRQQSAAIEGMTELINALLDVSKLESGAIQPSVRNFAVDEIFDRMRAQFTEPAQAKRLALSIESCAETGRSDPALLTHVIQNLVSNALRYTRHGTIAVRCLRNGDELCIEISDTGIGIPADQLDSIFEEFHQVSRASEEAQAGWGLGLSIVRRIAQLLGHAIDVESTLHRGSVFRVFLPRSEPSQVTSIARELQRTSMNDVAKTILLADDDIRVRNASALLLDIEGFVVLAVGSLEEAMECVGPAQTPDLIISDYQLGHDRVGTDLVQTIRERTGRDIPAIVVSGDTSSSAAAAAQAMHCRWLPKPVDPEELIELCREMLAEEQHRLR